MSGTPMSDTAVKITDERTAYAEEVRRAQLRAGLWGGAIGIGTSPLWIIFDRLVDPSRAGLFLGVFALDLIPIVCCWLALLTRWGRRYPSPLTLAYVVCAQVFIAWLIPRAGQAAAAYGLVMVFVIMAVASFMDWSWRWNAAQALIASVALAFEMATAPGFLTESQVASIAFFVGFSSVLAVAGQSLRERGNRREFASRYALVLEQARTRELLGRLERLSIEDPLTGLTNRRGGAAARARPAAHPARDVAPLTILLCDLDGLKRVNDTMGHPTGDRVLRAAAGALLAGVRAGDVVARLGGDEFGVLCPQMNTADAAELADRLRMALGRLDLPELAPGRITVSIGVAGLDGPEDSPTLLMSRADTRLYLAKRRRDAVSSGDETPNVLALATERS